MAKPTNNKLPPNLVALGTAAVLTVYGAGYWRTRAAAERFADDTRRRPAPPEAPHVAAAPDPAPPILAPALTPRTAPAAAAAVPAAPKTITSPTTAPDPASATKPTPAVATASSPSVPPAPVAVPSAAVPAAEATATAAPPAPAPAPASAASSSAAPASAAPTTATEAVAPAAPPAAPKWKDGSYTGWGTSRHGDIQATVVIENGRIASATISQCLTRYSCSWIAALPPQVISRQSPETDYVSGATQSTNAFYYAVVEALSKAK